MHANIAKFYDEYANTYKEINQKNKKISIFNKRKKNKSYLK